MEANAWAQHDEVAGPPDRHRDATPPTTSAGMKEERSDRERRRALGGEAVTTLVGAHDLDRRDVDDLDGGRRPWAGVQAGGFAGAGDRLTEGGQDAMVVLVLVGGGVATAGVASAAIPAIAAIAGGGVDELAMIGAGDVLDLDAVDEAADEGEDVDACQPEAQETSRQGSVHRYHDASVATATTMSTRDRPLRCMRTP
jgi:hypothetical protein